MGIEELARILSQMYNNGNGDKAAMIHLFGIRYARVIQENGFTAEQIIAQARLNGDPIPESYPTELNKGRKLSEYVIEKDRIRELLE